MSTETHTEAGGLAELIQGSFPIQYGLTAPAAWAAEVAADITAWLSARLTDDDVVEAGAKAISRAIWGSDTAKDEWTQEARAALAAAADVIGGER